MAVDRARRRRSRGAGAGRRASRPRPILGSSHQSPLPLALLLRWAGVGPHRRRQPRPRRLAARRAHHGRPRRPRGAPLRCWSPRRSASRRPSTTAWPSTSRAPDRLPDVAAALAAAGPTSSCTPDPRVPARTLRARRSGATCRRALASTGRQRRRDGGSRRSASHRSGSGGAARCDRSRRTPDPAPSSAAVLAGADAVVCGNTGPMHLAAAVGTPVVAAFAPTVPLARWRPWRVPHVVLGDQDVAVRRVPQPHLPARRADLPRPRHGRRRAWRPWTGWSRRPSRRRRRREAAPGRDRVGARQPAGGGRRRRCRWPERPRRRARLAPRRRWDATSPSRPGPTAPDLPAACPPGARRPGRPRRRRPPEPVAKDDLWPHMPAFARSLAPPLGRPAARRRPRPVLDVGMGRPRRLGGRSPTPSPACRRSTPSAW